MNWDIVREQIAKIADLNGGRLTPDDVIEHARNPDSPLHSLFNWDIEQAAMSHWRDQARRIISSVRVETKTDTTIVESVAYVRDPNVEPSEQGYISVAVLRDDKAMAAKAFAYEFSRAEGALTRAQEVAAVLQLEPQVKRLTKRVANLREKVSLQFA